MLHLFKATPASFDGKSSSANRSPRLKLNFNAKAYRTRPESNPQSLSDGGLAFTERGTQSVIHPAASFANQTAAQ